MSNSSFSLSSSSSIPKGVCLCGVKAEIKTSREVDAITLIGMMMKYLSSKEVPLPDPSLLPAPLPLSVPLPLPLPLPLPTGCTLVTAKVSAYIELLKLGCWLKLCGILELGGWLNLGDLLELGGLLYLGGWLNLGGRLELGGWLKLGVLLELGGLLELAAWLEPPDCPIPS
ncbi:hypothetical protein FXO38_21091 [Capsicum annuum]|nr:hypothetical protein FXO38_21091 [Capsicum annuum]